MKLHAYIFDMVYIKRTPELKDFFIDLRSEFSHDNPDWHKAKNQDRWTGNIYPTLNTWLNVNIPEYGGHCVAVPRGGLHKLRKVCEEHGHSIIYHDKRVVSSPIEGWQIQYDDQFKGLWPEQLRVAKAMYQKQNCFINAPTGSGKTVILFQVIEWILKEVGNVLIVVWETKLMKQWIKRSAHRFGIKESDIGIIKGKKHIIKPITIGMQQTLRNHPRRDIFNFGAMIGDEIQAAAAPTFQKVFNVSPAKYRLGVSADETRADQKEFLIYDSFGELAANLTNKEMVQKKRIMDATIRIVPTGWNFQIQTDENDPESIIDWRDLPPKEKRFDELLAYMIEDEYRNDLIWEFIKASLKIGQIITVASDRVDHAKFFHEKIKEAGYEVGLMIGTKKYSEEFDRTYEGLCNRTIQAGVGTIKKIATGHDIPPAERGFVLTPLAQNKQLFNQYRGRHVRRESKKRDVIIYYFWDEDIYPHHNGRLKRLYKKQVQIYTDGEWV